MTSPITIGISACLVGHHVRYDGGHKLDRCITETLGAYFTLLPVCPEVGCGLPTPREAMRLEGDPAAPRLMTCQTRIDRTGVMLAYCEKKFRELENRVLCGFVFKERSPSCGLTAVPLHRSDTSDMFSVGLFANEVVRCFPLMPLEEAELLRSPDILKSFIERVYLYRGMMDSRIKESSVDPLPLKAER